jgi:penicillin-binding protein 2
MDAWTGDVLAMVSSPGYDPDPFVTGISQAAWDGLQSNQRKPLSNKAISGAYAPGSTFKPIVALAALEAGVITPETTFTCPGFFMLGNNQFHCWKKGGHGTLALRDAIKHSCDVFFYETGKRLGIDRIAAMAKRMGLGAALGVELPAERSGLIPTTEWKLAVPPHVPWQLGETISASIGQSYILATPLQLATYAARLITSKAVVPRLTREAGVMTEESHPGRSPHADFAVVKVSQRDLRLVLDGMNAVVNEQGGTAYAARIAEPGMQMGGKSGTSQVFHMTEAERARKQKIKDIAWERRDHALFISFAPVSAPRYVCAVVVEHGGESAGGGSAVAAPICRDVLLETQKRDPARRAPDHPFGAPATVAQG